GWAEREAALSERETALGHRNRGLDEREGALSQRGTALTQREAELDARDRELAEHHHALGEHEAQLDQREQALAEAPAGIRGAGPRAAPPSDAPARRLRSPAAPLLQRALAMVVLIVPIIVLLV